MKTVVIVSPHFVPSFLAGVHRARLLAYHLPEFAWKPIILTTDPRYYECPIDPGLCELLPADLEVVAARAFPTKPIRLVGDVGLRSLPWYYDEVRRLAARRRIDFLYITIPSNLAALLGPRVERTLGIPYGIDYQDPWIPETPQGHRFASKAWFNERLGHWLEPIALGRASLITGVHDAYFASALRRNPAHRPRVVATVPFGHSSRDFTALERRPRAPFVFDPADGLLHMIYAGVMWPKAAEVLDRLLAAVAWIKDRNPALAARVRVHFVGTGAFPGDSTRGHQVLPRARRYGLDGLVTETPQRISYLDVLNHLRLTGAILIFGSTEPHYSPSKVYLSVMARRPIFAVLHERSAAVQPLRASRAGDVFTFTEDALPDPAALGTALERFLAECRYDPDGIDLSVFDRQSARESARILAGAMDQALGAAAAAA
jgi:hypothetical protein